MKDKEKIIERIDKIEQFARIEGNEWLLEELQRRFGSIEKVDEIYEYCIERVLKGQAKQFYKDFPIKDIVEGLQMDFVRMISFHRKDLFDEFAMAVYQQLERITNVVCRNEKLNESYSKLIGHPAYVGKKNTEGEWCTGLSDRSENSTYTIADLVFGKTNAFEKSQSSLIAQYAVDKMYCILYFLCYQAILQSQEYNYFKTYKDTLYKIYQFRNLNHRGSEMKDSQKEIVDEIKPQQGIYYFKFMQTLLFYVEGTIKGLAELDKLYEYAQKEQRIEIRPTPKVVGKIDLPIDEKRRFK